MLTTNLTSLPSLLRLTTLTVLLLTANWSSDTDSARKAIIETEGYVPCTSLQFLELDVSEHLLTHPDPPDEEDLDPVTRLTAHPPYLPFVRVLHNLSNHSDHAIHETPLEHFNNQTIRDYYSVDPLPLAHFLSSLCQSSVPFPHISTRDELSTAIHAGEKAAVLIDHEPFTKAWNSSYDILTRAAYTISYALAGKDDPFIATHSAPIPGVVLIDAKLDRYRVVDVSISDLDIAVEQFDRGSPVWQTEQVSPVRALRYFQRPAVWREYFERVTPMGLSGFLGERATHAGGKQSVLLVFVIDQSCAFCQRSLPEFEAFLTEVREVPNTYGEIVQVEELPGWLDPYVDGFPTVLLLREVDTGMGVWSRAAEYFGRREVSAFMDVL